LKHLTQVNDQTETLDSLLINTAQTVINKVARQQHSHKKDLGIILLALLQGAQPFSIHNHILLGGVILALNKLGPYPKPLGTCVNGGPDLEPNILIKQHPVEYVTLSGSVLADYCHHADVLLLVDFLEQPLYCLLVYGQFLVRKRRTFCSLVDGD